MSEPRFVFVATHDGGCEGQSLPVLVFEDRDLAMRWAAAQTEAWRITRTPIYPEPPIAEWFRVEAETP